MAQRESLDVFAITTYQKQPDTGDQKPRGTKGPMTQPAKVPATYPLTCCDAFDPPWVSWRPVSLDSNHALVGVGGSVGGLALVG